MHSSHPDSVASGTVPDYPEKAEHHGEDLGGSEVQELEPKSVTDRTLRSIQSDHALREDMKDGGQCV